MSNIYFTSDLHLGHNREFIWKARGFESIDAMNDTIISRWNNIITEDDDVYVLGDLMLGVPENISLIHRLRGKLHVIRGNHDTDKRLELYNDSYNIVEVCDAKYIKFGHYHFYLTHFPCMTGNLEKESLTQMTLNLSGHTHSKEKFFNDLPYVYNVAVDAHECKPISIEEIIADMKAKVQECKSYL